MHMPSTPKEIQLEHAWNENDCSNNIFIKEEDKFTLHRLNIAQSTDSIRGKVSYERGTGFPTF